MKRIAKWIALAFVLFLAAPVVVLPQDRWNDRDYYGYGRRDDKDAAYRAGYDEGYREGRRKGNSDLRHNRRPDNRYREYDRGQGYYGYYSRHKGDFKKGFRNGYREGYNDAYREYRMNHRY